MEVGGMATPRHLLVDLEATPYYHCISRCVRRAYLCGDDRYSGRNFDHRKGWLVERMKPAGRRLCGRPLLLQRTQ